MSQFLGLLAGQGNKPHACFRGDLTLLAQTRAVVERHHLSYQQYFSANMVCYEGKGVPADIELLNSTADIENGTDPLITVALEVLKSKRPVA
jgi:hypothetical protein